MTSEEVLALYSWSAGTCFRHPEQGEQRTTHLATLHPRTGAQVDIRGCEACVVRLEAERRRVAERDGAPYQPGQLGCHD